jgi:hypothetical protein
MYMSLASSFFSAEYPRLRGSMLSTRFLPLAPPVLDALDFVDQAGRVNQPSSVRSAIFASRIFPAQVSQRTLWMRWFSGTQGSRRQSGFR